VVVAAAGAARTCADELSGLQERDAEGSESEEEEDEEGTKWWWWCGSRRPSTTMIGLWMPMGETPPSLLEGTS
jgi:hypothetical protein